MKEKIRHIYSFLTASLIKGARHLLSYTWRFQFQGMERFLADILLDLAFKKIVGKRQGLRDRQRSI